MYFPEFIYNLKNLRATDIILYHQMSKFRNKTSERE